MISKNFLRGSASSLLKMADIKVDSWVASLSTNIDSLYIVDI